MIITSVSGAGFLAQPASSTATRQKEKRRGEKIKEKRRVRREEKNLSVSLRPLRFIFSPSLRFVF
jgi:hypothetical protein